MPDTTLSPRPPAGGAPADNPPADSWHDAFAALPLESPPAGGWNTIATHLPARQRRWPAWLAMAAALALAIGLPLYWAWQPSDPPTASTELAADPPAHPVDAPAQVTHTQPRQHIQVPANKAPADQTIADGTATPAIATSDRMPRTMPATTAHADDRQTVQAAIADKPMPTTARSPTTSTAITQPSTVNQAALAQLHVESARLEALLALTRDERVSSASAALLSDHFDDQLGTIDTALMQPALTERQRLGLWRERVSALRQLAGFTSTQRVLAAYGQRDDVRLASIY